MIKKILSLVDQKLLRFIIVGCINTVVGTAIMFGLYNLASCSYWVSSAANYILRKRDFTINRRKRLLENRRI